LTAEVALDIGGLSGWILCATISQVVPGRGNSYESEDLMKADHYDSFAESYSTDNESSLFNAYYERPAMIDLAGDVDGRRVLDAGCGSGPLSAALHAKGAIVTGFDSSPAMVELARRRLGENAALHVADLRRVLPFPDGAFR
jgi:ubiquinone/menaquinone biosynthesis C-methylase UbiE